ncbi:hypothetical protein O181_084318 [Austropuccinia psidii MF-1]|uniref:Uncharacterized protein n=1 Tax=Austropuccinia psidii MF-1 TaxID=1389203 RepID=A0A9Q3FVF3_9BASI|nr:hypothetical protein [Austropuccinia psidii MF-1]
MENTFESAIFNSEKDKPITWFLKQKERLSALHPDMSDSMINMEISRKCVGELEHAIKCRCVEPAQQKTISMPWKISLLEKNCTSHLAKTYTKKAKINEVQVIGEVQCTEDKEESDLDSTVSEDTPGEDYPIENIKSFLEVTEVHTHLPQYSEDFHNLINIQDARMCKSKPPRGAFCTCVGKDYLQAILPGCRSHLLVIEGVKISSVSNNMYTLGILETNLVFPHPAGSVRMKTEIVLMDDCTSQHITLGNDYLNIYGIDMNNHKDRYFTIGEKKRLKFAFSNMPQKISVISSIKDTYKEEFVANQLVEAQMNPSLSPKMRHDLIDVLYTYQNAFASVNEPLGGIKGHEVDINLSISRPYPPVLRRPAYPASPRAREASENISKS